MNKIGVFIILSSNGETSNAYKKQIEKEILKANLKGVILIYYII